MKPSLRDAVCRLLRDARGLTTVEYAIVLCLIAALAVGSWQAFGENLEDALIDADNEIQQAINP